MESEDIMALNKDMLLEPGDTNVCTRFCDTSQGQCILNFVVISFFFAVKSSCCFSPEPC